ncbi:MAG: hypothetical protein AAFO73_10670 [Pseudomonadota bacterium]
MKGSTTAGGRGATPLSLFDDLKVVEVLLPIPAERAYSYAVPEGLDLQPGDYVQVPLGPRRVAGVVWDPSADGDGVGPSKLRPVDHRFDCPPVSPSLRAFISWLADYTVSSPGMVLRSLLRVPTALDPEPPLAGLRYTGVAPQRLTKARQRLITFLADTPQAAWTKSGLANASGVTPSVVEGLVKLGLFEPVDIPAPAVVAPPQADFSPTRLSVQQAAVANALKAAVTAQGFSTHLIDGVTGSGKTEVYFEALAAALTVGKQVLILLPQGLQNRLRFSLIL